MVTGPAAGGTWCPGSGEIRSGEILSFASARALVLYTVPTVICSSPATVASEGLLYFICASIAHLRVGDRGFGGAVFSCCLRRRPCTHELCVSRQLVRVRQGGD